MDEPAMRHRVLGDIARLLVQLDAEISEKGAAADETKRLQALLEKQSKSTELQQEKEKLLEELAALKKQNEVLKSRNSELENVQSNKEMRSLNDRTISIENKENLNPSTSLDPSTTDMNATSSKMTHIGIQTENTSEASSSSEYDELAKKHEHLRQTLKYYKDAHTILSEKYRRNKEIWTQWVERDKEANLSVAPSDSIDRAPSVSPDHPFIALDDEWKSSPPTAAAANAVTNPPISLSKRAGLLHTDAELPVLEPACEEVAQARGDEIYDTDETTDGEGEVQVGAFSPTSRAILRRTQRVPSQVLPRNDMGPPARVKKEKNTIHSPVVIKSEPRSSNSMDHFVFTQQSLDLDDIGDKPDTPRKMRLMSSYQRRGSGGKGKRKEGSLMSPRALKQMLARMSAEQEELDDLARDRVGDHFDAQEEVSVKDGLPPPPEAMHSYIPTLPASRLSGIRPIVIIEDSQPTDPAAVDESTKLPRPHNYHSKETGYVPQPESSPPPLTLSTLPRESPQRNVTPKKKTKKKLSPRQTRSRQKLAQIVPGIEFMVEDGTDGIERLERDTGHVATGKDKGLLKGLLGNAPLASPSIAHLRHSHEPGSRAVSPIVPQTTTRVNDEQMESTPIPSRGKTAKRHETPATEPPVSKRSKLNNQSGRKSLPSTTVKEKGKGKAIDTTTPTNPRQLRNRDTSDLKISDFLINPEASKGLGYAFHETVRKKDERKCLPSCARPCCKGLAKFVEHAGIPDKLPTRAPRWRSSPPGPLSDSQDNDNEGNEDDEKENHDRELEKKVKRFSDKFLNHRDHFERPKTPPGFWDSAFPTTQEMRENNRAARMEEREKVDGMRREAKKGGGRYVFRDEA
ncbi:DNA repair protein endonuclease SAE2/CtIP C-terminus-domain-containing protein [Peziza echinospora]|nr:DNA repair protein endonuclease SAE2/CtIP C-terminus-domain-containing protein [Peziza echinospora]